MQNEPIRDPLTGTVIVTLKDGVARKLRLDFYAMCLAEEAAGVSVLTPLTNIWGSARGIRALLFAGFHRDAMERKEPWTLERVTDLVDAIDLREIDALLAWSYRVNTRGPEVVAKDEPAGESRATAATASRKGRGAGTKR